MIVIISELSCNFAEFIDLAEVSFTSDIFVGFLLLDILEVHDCVFNVCGIDVFDY